MVLVAGIAVGGWFLIPNRWFYRDRRPTRFGRITNRVMAGYSSLGLPPGFWVTLETRGRRSGRPTSTTLVIGEHQGGHYLVSMLGERSAWVHNVRAAGGRAVIRHGRRRPVQLEEVPADERAPIIRAYLHRAYGARPHVPIPPTAPVAEFERIAAAYPVFRITNA